VNALVLLAGLVLAAQPAFAQSTPPTPVVSANGDDRLLHLASEMAGSPKDAATPQAPKAAPSPPPQPVQEALPLGPRGGDATGVLRPMSHLAGKPADHDAGGTNTGTGIGTTPWLFNTLTALGAVIGIIFLVKAGHKKWAQRGGRILAGSGGPPVVEVLGRTIIAPRSHLVLVRLGQRILVLGDSPNGLRTLAELDQPDEVAGLVARLASTKTDSISGGFNHLLGRFHSDYRETRPAADEGGDQHEHVIDRARDQLGSLLSRLRSAGKGGSP
jgi:flagellar biogenesis protein FliO